MRPTAFRSFTRAAGLRSMSSTVPRMAVKTPVQAAAAGKATGYASETAVPKFAGGELGSRVSSGLSPTLKKFTLDGKVAVVTGYVSIPPHLSPHPDFRALVWMSSIADLTQWCSWSRTFHD